MDQRRVGSDLERILDIVDIRHCWASRRTEPVLFKLTVSVTKKSKITETVSETEKLIN